MSEDNTAIARRAFDTLRDGVRNGDLAGAFDRSVSERVIASDLDWRGGRRAGIGVAGVGDFVGRDGFVEFIRTFTEDFDDYDIEAERIVDAGGDRVVVITRQHATGKESRVPVEMRTGAVFTLAQHRIERVELFIDPENALRAAGLRT